MTHAQQPTPAGDLREALRAARDALANYACYAPGAPCIRARYQCDSDCGKDAGDALIIVDAVLSATPPAQQVDAQPIPMLLFCPMCGLQHVDEPDERTPDWDNPPHRLHLCHACGCIWRPADVPTEGVRNIGTAGKNDTWIDAAPVSPAPDATVREKVARIIDPLSWEDTARYPVGGTDHTIADARRLGSVNKAERILSLVARAGAIDRVEEYNSTYCGGISPSLRIAIERFARWLDALAQPQAGDAGEDS